jgi:hypothetical protein
MSTPGWSARRVDSAAVRNRGLAADTLKAIKGGIGVRGTHALVNQQHLDSDSASARSRGQAVLSQGRSSLFRELLPLW